MNKRLKSKIMESLSSVLPITGIVLLLSISIIPMPAGTLVMFLAGALLLILGMGFFSLGVDLAMLPMGEGIGVEMTKTKRIGIAVFACLFIGVIITVATMIFFNLGLFPELTKWAASFTVGGFSFNLASPINWGAIAMLAGLIEVPLVSLFTKDRHPADTEEIFAALSAE